MNNMPMMNYDWYESLSAVTIVLYNCNDIEYVMEKDNNGYINRLIIKYTPEDIVVNFYANISEYEIKKYKHKMEIILQKVEKGKWGSLNRISDGEKEDYIHINSNWLAIDEECRKDKKESLMEMFQNVYEEGDGNVRRAMNKSILQSDGTVLTNNWSDVKDKKVEKK
ncbi:SGT1-like protein [Spraguea lophii 42_110]|uniref:SGT1-like protein n=1 Tax=Spraguea lophii (strain 42_110) TaxID=1358809 RepID=S7W6U1_SPRLO|nr:SGT1-like protein [Spraguea lophii 42_110]